MNKNQNTNNNNIEVDLAESIVGVSNIKPANVQQDSINGIASTQQPNDKETKEDDDSD